MVLLIIRFAIQVINLECFLLSYLGLKELLSFHIPCPAGIMSFYANNYSTTFLFTIAIWTRLYSKGTIQCFGAPLEVLEQVAGFEPASAVWKTTVLTTTLYLHDGKRYFTFYTASLPVSAVNTYRSLFILAAYLVDFSNPNPSYSSLVFLNEGFSSFCAFPLLVLTWDVLSAIGTSTF